ncbi:MAG: hypothetical protein JSV19_09750 [Phycisphaerales bacterium]|nr:MAG: hypothetical protein JSV19_09750 [Phycisphaerales bacterium]
MVTARGKIGLACLSAALCFALVVIAEPRLAPPADESTKPTTPPANDAEPEAAPQEPPTEADQPAVKPDQPPADGTPPSAPSAEEVIKAFEQDRPRNVAIPPVSTTAAAAKPADQEGKRPPTRYPDGYLLIDRAGRVRQDGQWWTFVFESDSPSFEEPPMKLLPNRMLERAVFEVRGAPNIVFIVSGEITDYQGENFMLLRKLLRRRDLGNLKK